MTTPQQHTSTQQSADDFLMGGGVPSAKFPVIGHTVSGRITTRPTVEQQRDYTSGELKFWDDGGPQMQMVVTLATNERDTEVQDDDGTRRIYVKGQMKQAVAQAVRAAGGRGLEVGGVLTVTYARDGERKNPRFNAPKNYEAQYTPAATNELHTPEPQQQAPVGTVPQQHVQAAMQNPAAAQHLAQQQGQQQVPDQPPF